MDTNKSQAATDLNNLASALSTAVASDFMAREHGALVWKKFLKESGLDIPKKAPVSPTPDTSKTATEVQKEVKA